MELKRAKVVMLPTKYNDVSIGQISISVHDKRMFISPNNVSYTIHQPQHLYFTVEDEIKEGDWFLNSNGTEVHKCLEIDSNGDYRYNRINRISKGKGKKIITTTDTSLKLPQPSQAFIEKYCKLGGIDEVDVEYTPQIGDWRYSGLKGISAVYYIPKTDSHNIITIHPIKNSWNKEEVCELLRQYLIFNTSVEYMSPEDFINLKTQKHGST